MKLAIYGNEPYLKRRYAQSILSKLGNETKLIEFNAEDPHSSILSSAVFYDSAFLCVWNADKLEGEPDFPGIYVFNRKPKEWAGDVKEYTFKSPWEKEKAAKAFFQKALMEEGLACSDNIADAVIGRLGSDFGFLDQEIKKIIALHQFNKERKFNLQLLQCLAPIREQGLDKLIDMFKKKSKKGFLEELSRIYGTHKSDPTLLIVRMIASYLYKWISFSSLRKKFDHDTACRELGMNQWYVKHQILPALAKWKMEDMKRVLVCLSEIEDSVFDGKVSTQGMMAGLVGEF